MTPARDVLCTGGVETPGNSLEKRRNSFRTALAQAEQRCFPLLSLLGPKQPPWEWSCARKKENEKSFWGERRSYCRCLGYCRVLPKRGRREGERQWGKGNIYQALKEADGGSGRESACRLSPVGMGLVLSLQRSLSALFWATISLSKPQGALGKAGSCGCLGRVPVLWQHCPLASSVLCPGRHPARTPVSPSQEAQLPPELCSGREPSPARTLGDAVSPPAAAGGCWPCWDSPEEPFACYRQDGNLPN